MLFYVMLCHHIILYVLLFAAAYELWWNKEDEGKDLTGASCGAFSTEETVKIDSAVPSTEVATENTVLLSLAADCSVTEDSNTLSVNADDGIIGSTWADGLQVYTCILMYCEVLHSLL